ncbi:cupin domain-containing protein [Thermoplasmatota archaeon]
MNIDKNKVLRLVDLSNYHDNSIVSQTMINTKCGTVTFFAFDEGQGLSEHSAPYDALVYLLDGEAKITIEENIHILKKGEMIIMPADKPHALQAIKKFKMILILIGR